MYKRNTEVSVRAKALQSLKNGHEDDEHFRDGKCNQRLPRTKEHRSFGESESMPCSAATMNHVVRDTQAIIRSRDVCLGQSVYLHDSSMSEKYGT